MIMGSRRLIELEDLSIGYHDGGNHTELFTSINATVVGGEVVAVVGSNGAGKSTLLRTITSLHKPLAGRITLSGRDIRSCSPVELASRISFVSASSAVSPYLTIYEVVSLGRFPHTNWIGRMTDKDRIAVDRAIRSVGIEGLSQRRIGEVSAGDSQRSMIARALAQDTGLVVLDEPTAYLDLPNKYELISLLRALSLTEGKSFIYTTHDLHIAVGESDKIWLLGGRGFVEGSPEDLMIQGAFSGLFAGSRLELADESGLYTYPVKSIGRIRIDADEPLAKVTSRLLYRLKIDVGNEPDLPIITARGRYLEAEWSVHAGDDARKFDHLYDLAAYLKGTLFYQPNLT